MCNSSVCAWIANRLCLFLDQKNPLSYPQCSASDVENFTPISIMSMISVVASVGNSSISKEPLFIRQVEKWVNNFKRIYADRIGLNVLPQLGAADAEIKVSSGENTELKRSPFQAWSRSVYSHTCYAYCEGFLPCLFLPFPSIHLHFFQNLSRIFPVLAVANTGSWVGPQNEIGHPVGCRFPCWVPAEYE